MAATSGLTVSLFGQASFRSGSDAVKFSKRNRTIPMLARIILQRGAPVSRDVLAFSVFPDDDEASAIAELRRYLYLASKALPERSGEPWLIADADTVRWNIAAGAAIDVLDFEEFAREPATYERAVELYTGDLLDEIYDDWIVAERERLRTQYLTVLEDLLERHRSARRFGAAIACAKRILATDPWREDTVRALMSVRYEAGDTAGALAECEQFAKHLRDELSVSPMPETLAVRQSIVRGEALPGALTRATVILNAPARTSVALPFIGRARELDMLHAAWTRAARGTSAFVLVEGEAGVGKTRLADEFARRVQSEGGRVFVGTTAAPESTPYQSLVEALRSAMPLLLARPPIAARRAALAQLLPELRDPCAPDSAAPEPSAERARARLYDALADAVRRLGSPRPAAIVLEDLQWAGSATLDALGEIVKELVHAPVLFLATCREEETPPGHALRTMVRDVGTIGTTSEIALARFDENEVSDLVSHVDRLREAPMHFARELFTQSEGNALFVNEFISGALETNGAERDVSSIAGVIASRVGRLGEQALTVAEIAAVAGPGCSVQLVRDVSNMPAADAARGFDELLDRRILREAGARAQYDYVFTHHLIADAIYAGIDSELAARRHSRIAHLLEEQSRHKRPVSEREIARHHERAGNVAAATAWYIQAARAAARIHAYGDTIALATQALRLAPPDDTKRAALTIREHAHSRRAERGEQRADIEQLEQLAGNDPRHTFAMLARRVELARTLGESDAEGSSIAAMHRLIPLLDDAAHAQALLQSATHAGLRSRPAEGIAPARAALAIYERSADVRGQLECLYLLTEFTANMGDVAASRAYLAQMHDRAGDLGDKLVEARALSVAAQAALLRADYRTSYDLSLQALALQVATDDRDGEANSRGRAAVSAAWLGDFAVALRDFDAALDTYASIGNKRGLALTHTNRTLLLMRLGLFADALESIRQSNELFAIVHEERTVVANHVNASFVHLQLGDGARAKALAEMALELARRIAFPVFEAAALANLGNAERSLGDYAAAIAHMEAGIALRAPVQEPRDYMDDLADLTLAYVAAGRSMDALATARRLHGIANGSFEGALWPHYIRWAAAAGFAAGAQTERAAAQTARAQAELYDFAGRIDDERARAAFLAIPVNRAIAGPSASSAPLE